MTLPVSFVLLAPAFAQPIISTFAGSEYRFDGDGKRAIQAPLGTVSGVAVDQLGQVYIADRDNNMVARFTPNGVLTVIAGNGNHGISGDGGPATRAAIDNPAGVAVNAAGFIYIAEESGCRIRKVSPDGTISTAAGTGVQSFADGPAAVAGFRFPKAVALDSAGNLYIADTSNYRIRKLSTDGVVTTLAGNGEGGFSGDNGPATSARMSPPAGIAVDSRGDVYFADSANNRVRKISNGVITTVAGDGRAGYSGDGPATQVSLMRPSGLAFDAAGNLYIADADNHRIRRLSTTGNLTTIAGSANRGFSGDGGSATAATLDSPVAVALDSTGNLYIADSGNSRVRRVSSFGAISTAAGSGSFGASGDGGPALSASFRKPAGIAVDMLRNVYMVDQEAQRVRKIDTSGVITTIAGTGESGFTGDRGPGVNGSLNDPAGVAVDRLGNVYVTDTRNQRIRKITPDGVITTFAGGGDLDGNGIQATRARLFSLEAITTDAGGSVYFGDNNSLRKVSPDGVLTTVAGGGASLADNVPATSAAVKVEALAVDTAGNIYFAEPTRVRKISTSGILTTVAGTSDYGCDADGMPATSTRLYNVSGLAIDRTGNLYISNSVCHRIVQVTSSGALMTVAGDGMPGFAGDGAPATAARLAFPQGIAFDHDGNLYIADTGNKRIRRVLTAAPVFDPAPLALSFSANAGGVVPPIQTLTLKTAFSGPAFEINLSTSDGAAWLATNALNGSLPTTLQVFADPTGLDPGTYEGAITIRVAGASPPQRVVPVTFTVGLSQPARPSADPASLTFTFVRGAIPIARQLIVSNQGGGAFTFSTSATVNSGGEWLTISPAAGSATASSSFALTVTADPSKLQPGAYSGVVVISASTGAAFRIPITATVAAGQQTILLSQTGLTFTAVAAGGAVPPQTFGILNIGQGEMAWSVRASTLSGGAGWLRVTPDSGSASAASVTVPLVEVSVNHAGLTAGDYYGQIEIAAGAVNSPQIVTVVLNVLAAGSDPGPLIRPTGLIFVTPPGSSPGSQDVLVSNLTASPTGFISGRLSDRPGNLFQHLPVEASVAPAQPVRITVQPTLSNVDPQVYRGTLTLQFSNGAAHTVSLLFVVAGGAQLPNQARAAAGCAPSRLIPVFTSLAHGFSVPVSWPTPVEVRVVDDCGNPMADGAVVATFSDGEPPLVLKSLKDGRWTATWLALSSQSQVTVTVNARFPGASVAGTAQLTGGLRANVGPPVVSPGAVVNAASLTRLAPLAPGALITIFGSRLTDAPATAPGLPLPSELGGTRVLIGGRSLPLRDVSPERVNAQIPFDIPVNTRLQLILGRGAALSTPPEEITVASAQPAIFTLDQSGGGQGLIFKLSEEGQTIADSSHPLKAGDRVLIHCTGLGPVNPPFDAGASPADPPPTTMSPVALSIGGVSAEVSFAGLLSGVAGVYQVRATIPDGVPSGDAVQFILSVADQASAPVTASIQ